MAAIMAAAMLKYNVIIVNSSSYLFIGYQKG